ncbi:MAG TPA: family 20 glycosylhydrolase, partial [Spirochaetia bacterium]|nr:family 20 glycosylhydrolase [Spirochaetia bacterium]
MPFQAAALSPSHCEVYKETAILRRMTPSLVPLPERLEMIPGTFRVPPRSRWTGNAQIRDALAGWLPRVGRSPAVDARLQLREDSSRRDLGEEGYELAIRSGEATAVARTTAGLAFAAQTLRQLAAVNDCTIPCCHIIDRPRFSWRGVHLDSARHFFPVGTILRLLDLSSLHKMNRFHWHLTDDQGWRLPVRSRPLLTKAGAREGHFYSHRDVQRVVARAHELGMTVIPEIDLPGHMQAAIAAYPELGCARGRVSVRRSWGISRHVLNPEPGTLQFLEEVLDEVLW